MLLSIAANHDAWYFAGTVVVGPTLLELAFHYVLAKLMLTDSNAPSSLPGPAVCSGNPPEPGNGVFSCASPVSINTVCTATCNEGYKGDPTAPSATCLSTGTYGPVTGACTLIRKYHGLVSCAKNDQGCLQPCAGWFSRQSIMWL